MKCTEKSEYSCYARGRHAASRARRIYLVTSINTGYIPADVCQVRCPHSVNFIYNRYLLYQLAAILQIDLQRWGKNIKKYPFKVKFRKYHVSDIKFFSPKSVKTSHELK